MSSMVHLSSGRACSSSVKGPCLVRVSSSTLAQEESSTATKGEKEIHQISDSTAQSTVSSESAQDHSKGKCNKPTLRTKSTELKQRSNSKILFSNSPYKLL